MSCLRAFAPLLCVCCFVLLSCGGGQSKPATPTTPATPAPPTTPVTSPCAGPASTVRSTEPIPAAVSQMLSQVKSEISAGLKSNQDSLPRNARWTAEIQAKISMLQNENLAAQIVDGRMYVADGLSSSTAAIAVFPAEYMRAEATQAVHDVVAALPVLEDFMAMPYQMDHIYIWYGFAVGSSGGGGLLHMEDQSCYQSRVATGTFAGYPYEAMLDHEVAHGYIAHESSTQFLEVYTHNLVHVRSADFTFWTYVRSYTGMNASNKDVDALLDIYRMLGRDLMAQAYRKLYALRPPYGQPLPAACQQVFVDVAPDSLKTQVAAKAAQIGY